MSAIEALIKIKKQAKTDDLIQLLDEVVLYEKLSKIDAFKDLRTSTVAQKKVPLLSGAYKGDMYALSMVTLAGHIIRHLENTVPDVLAELEDQLTEKEQKRLLVMQKSLIQTTYLPLSDYDHEKMGEQVVAVFSNERTDKTALLIVVRQGGAYHIYQGYYMSETNHATTNRIEPYHLEQADMTLSILTYSIQGNNAYPFGELTKQNKPYAVMLPNHECLWLRNMKTGELFTMNLTMEQRNKIGMGKAHIESFAEAILAIIIEGGLV